MKFLILLVTVTVTVTQGLSVPNTRVTRSAGIPAPNLIALTAFDPPGFEVDWTPVKSPDERNPVIGYKVKVWEVHPVKTYKYEVVNGKIALVETYEPAKLTPSHVPEGRPKEILVSGAETTRARMENIRFGVTYETRVQAVTRDIEGPLSAPSRIELKEK